MAKLWITILTLAMLPACGTSINVHLSTSPDSAIQDAMRATVIVFGDGGGRCAGFIHDNRIITAAHCVEPSGLAQIFFFDDAQEGGHVSHVVFFSAEFDVAIIDICEGLPANLPSLPLASNDAELGEDVFSIGHPMMLDWSLSRGIVADPRRDYVLREGLYTQTTIDAAPGSSGSPIVDADGYVVGLVAFYAASPTITLAVHYSVIRDALRTAGPRCR